MLAFYPNLTKNDVWPLCDESLEHNKTKNMVKLHLKKSYI